MTRTHLIASLTMFLLVAGCASDPQQPATAGETVLRDVKISQGVADIAKQEGKVDIEKDKRLNCERYRPTGSNRVQYRCTTVAERDKAAQESQDAMRDAVKPSSSTGLIR